MIAIASLLTGASLVAHASPCEAPTPAANESARIADVAIESQTSYWTGLMSSFGAADGFDDLAGRGMFVISGSVKNVSASPIHHVTLRYELLDAQGNVVTYEEGYNAAAETLLTRGPAGDAGNVTPIAPGASDHFRMIFLSSELPPFDRPRVTVVGAE